MAVCMLASLVIRLIQGFEPCTPAEFLQLTTAAGSLWSAAVIQEVWLALLDQSFFVLQGSVMAGQDCLLMCSNEERSVCSLR